MYCGRFLELFVGTLCLVDARVCLGTLKGERFVGLTVTYPRERSYALFSADAEQLYIGLMGAVVRTGE